MPLKTLGTRLPTPQSLKARSFLGSPIRFKRPQRRGQMGHGRTSGTIDVDDKACHSTRSEKLWGDGFVRPAVSLRRALYASSIASRSGPWNRYC